MVPAVVHAIQTEDGLVYTKAITNNKEDKAILKKHQNFIADKDEAVGIVIIASDHQLTCFPGNAMITIQGKTSNVKNKKSYMLETAAHSNLPSGVVVNCSYVTSKTGTVSLIPANITSGNIWIRQQVLAADI